MKLSKQQNCICAWLCVAQVFLLSLASVSPQIHMLVCYGEQHANACVDMHASCSGLPETSEGKESQSELPDQEDVLCPVILFSQGVVFEDGSSVQSLKQLIVITFIQVELGKVWESYLSGQVQARAPPIS